MLQNIYAACASLGKVFRFYTMKVSSNVYCQAQKKYKKLVLLHSDKNSHKKKKYHKSSLERF